MAFVPVGAVERRLARFFSWRRGMATAAAMLPKAVAPGMDVDMPDVLGLPTGKGAGASQTDLYSRMKALQKQRVQV